MNYIIRNINENKLPTNKKTKYHFSQRDKKKEKRSSAQGKKIPTIKGEKTTHHETGKQN